ncbi:MAG: glycosyltransferase family 2 protein [Candidatus Omnitrophota bacterium]
MAEKIAVIILNWNGNGDTLECLESVYRIAHSSLDVIVADNGSTDNSVALIRERFPQVAILEHHANLGYAEGNNRAISHAISRGAEYILVLNNDAVVDPEILVHFLNAMRKLSDAAFLGAKIYYYDEPDKIWSMGGRWSLQDGTTFSIGQGEIDDHKRWELITETDFVLGCALFFKADLIAQIGLMEKKYFLMWEETDWCFQAKKVAGKCYVVPGAKVWHKVAASFMRASGNPLRRYFLTRNRMLWMERNIAFRERFLVYKRVIIPELVNSVRGYVSWRSSSSHRIYCKMYLWAMCDYIFRRFGDAPDAIRALRSDAGKTPKK